MTAEDLRESIITNTRLSVLDLPEYKISLSDKKDHSKHNQKLMEKELLSFLLEYLEYPEYHQYDCKLCGNCDIYKI